MARPNMLLRNTTVRGGYAANIVARRDGKTPGEATKGGKVNIKGPH